MLHVSGHHGGACWNLRYTCRLWLGARRGGRPAYRADQRSSVALEPNRAIRLARTLRELRESAWPGVRADPGPAGQGAQRRKPGGVSDAQLLGVAHQPQDARPRAGSAPTRASSRPAAPSMARSRTCSPRRTSPPTSSSASASWRRSCWACCTPTRRARAEHLLLRRRPGDDHLPRGARGRAWPTGRPAQPQLQQAPAASPTSTPCWRSGATSAPRTPTLRPD